MFIVLIMIKKMLWCDGLCVLCIVLLCIVYKHGVWCMVYGVWCMVYGLWCMLYSLWSVVYGVSCMVYG